nr:site-specific integrase [uncultured Rhodopila sp.]
MELFIIRRAWLDAEILVDGSPLTVAGEVYTLPEAARAVLAYNAIPDGMPFVLSANAAYEPTVSEWLLSLPGNGFPSENTWSSYGRDAVVFGRFLREVRGKTLLEADADDIRTYYRARRITSAKPLSASSWNRAVYALESFYERAVDMELIQKPPFSYRKAKASSLHQRYVKAGVVNAALENVGSGLKIKCITLDDYLKFRDIGLRGLLPDGTCDPEFRGRNGLRNSAIAESMVGTGIRLSECSWMLLAELPDPTAPQWNGFRACKMQLAKPTTKGIKGRVIWFPMRVLREYVRPYIREDRGNQVSKSSDRGLYRTVRDTIRVTAWRSTDCVIATLAGRERRGYDALTQDQRRRMFSIDREGMITEPGLLWLSESGMGIDGGNIEKFFERACERCLRFGIHLYVTPHILRHTFAVYMLSHLIKEAIGGLPEVRRQKQSLDQRLYREMFTDPLRTLQRLLGHASYITTFDYLTYIEEAEDFVEKAVASWGDRLGPPSEFLAGDTVE